METCLNCANLSCCCICTYKNLENKVDKKKVHPCPPPHWIHRAVGAGWEAWENFQPSWSLVTDLGLHLDPHQPETLAALGCAGWRRLSKAWVWQPEPSLRALESWATLDQSLKSIIQLSVYLKCVVSTAAFWGTYGNDGGSHINKLAPRQTSESA